MHLEKLSADRRTQSQVLSDRAASLCPLRAQAEIGSKLHTGLVTCWKRKDSDRFFWLSCHSLKWRTASSTFTIPSFTCSCRVISCRWPGVFMPANGSYMLDCGLSLHGLTGGSGEDGKHSWTLSHWSGVNKAGHRLRRTYLKETIIHETKKGDL